VSDCKHCMHVTGTSFTNNNGTAQDGVCCYCGARFTRIFTRGKMPGHGPHAPTILVESAWQQGVRMP